MQHKCRALMTETSRWLVFTYGTLKRGEPNHHVLSDKENGIAEFRGEARLKERFPLIIASRYNIPFLLDRPGLGECVKGELYSVDEHMLAALDHLETHPTFYTRREEPASLLNDPLKELRPWVYLLPRFKPEMLEKKPYLEEYRSEGEHGLPYITSDDIDSAEDIDL